LTIEQRTKRVWQTSGESKTLYALQALTRGSPGTSGRLAEATQKSTSLPKTGKREGREVSDKKSRDDGR